MRGFRRELRREERVWMGYDRGIYGKRVDVEREDVIDGGRCRWLREGRCEMGERWRNDGGNINVTLSFSKSNSV